MKTSETYRRHARDVNAFADALHGLLRVMEPHGGDSFGGTAPTWSPQAGQEAEAGRLRADVDLLAGRAAYAFAAAGSFIEWKPRGTWQTRAINPAQAWATILDWDPMFDVDVIFACARQSLGILDMKAEEAEDFESQRVRRAAGNVARITGAGLEPLARWTARGVGTLVLGVAAAGLTYWLGWG